MNDYGYEPWARAAVARGEHISTEWVAELLTSLDKARDDLAKARARIAELEAGEVRTEWGVRWPNDEVELVESEQVARNATASKVGRHHGAQAISRQVGSWTAADTTTSENPS